MFSSTALFALTLAVSSAIAGRVPFELVKERAGARTSSPVSGGSILAGAPVSNITVTPSGVVQCGTATVQWTGVVEPVQLFIAVGGMYVGETPLATLSGLSGGSTTWQVAAPAGDTLIFQITDSTNQVGYIQNIPVQSSTDTSCLSAASSAAAPSASASGAGDSSASPSGGDDDSSAAPSTAVASTPVASASPDAASSSDADAAAATSSSSKSKASASATQAAVTAATTGALTIATPKTTASAVTSVGLAGAQSTPQSSVTNGASGRAGPAIGIATLLSGAAILACLL